MKVILYPHGGSGNHGCEAIVRSTMELLNAEATVLTSAKEEDLNNGLDVVCAIADDRAPLQHSFAYWRAWFNYHVRHDRDAFDIALFRPIFKAAQFCDCALSIGGDNYCYGVPRFIYIINQQLRKRGIKTILWGCSIEESAMEGEMIDDLAAYSHIYARESLTYEALLRKGLKSVSLYPDPAFLLKRKSTSVPQGFVEGNTVGINISPMIIAHEQSKGLVLRNYIQMITDVLQQTDMQVALIPHVVWAHNDDRQPLRLLYEQFESTGRVVMIDDRPAEELKDIIARCRYFVAARTHASIAAYSTQVPTLVVGYSVKALGIAKDIFGEVEPYVIPVQSLQQTNTLTYGLRWLMAYEEKVRTHYRSYMPDYIGQLEQLDIERWLL